jgi:hypothetical protein
MTRAQWVMEYIGLQNRESDLSDTIGAIYKNSFRGLRDLFIMLLGLKFKNAPIDADPDAFPEFTPMSLLVGRPDVIKLFMEKEEKEEAAEVATTDEQFDEWSKKLAAGDYSDMDPIVTDSMLNPDPNARWHSEEMQQSLRALGIKIVDPEEGNVDG